jgi:hypothetical protein
MVGPNGLEPSTSSVSGRRSNQLSYGPTSIAETCNYRCRVSLAIAALTMNFITQRRASCFGIERYGISGGLKLVENRGSIGLLHLGFGLDGLTRRGLYNRDHGCA